MNRRCIVGIPHLFGSHLIAHCYLQMVSLDGDLLIVIGKKVANALKLLIYINLMKTSTLIRCFHAPSECIKLSQMSLVGAQLPR
jgi:hypothetical protein